MITAGRVSTWSPAGEVVLALASFSGATEIGIGVWKRNGQSGTFDAVTGKGGVLDWGDGTTEPWSERISGKRHEYAAGQYTIRIHGRIERIAGAVDRNAYAVALAERPGDGVSLAFEARGVKEIGDCVVKSCMGAVIGAGCETIGGGAAEAIGSGALMPSDIRIASTVREIKNYAFQNFIARYVHIASRIPPTISGFSFKNRNTVFKIPVGTTELYRRYWGSWAQTYATFVEE